MQKNTEKGSKDLLSISDLFSCEKIRNVTFGILLGLIAIIYLVFEYYQDGDFFIYYHASRELFQFKNIYRELYGSCECFPYYGSPTLAFLLGAFGILPFFFAAFLWKAINILLIYRSWILIEKYFDLTDFSKKEYFSFIFFSILSVSFVIYRNFHLNQFTIFLLYVILEGLNLIRTNRQVPGAALIALGIIIKVMPIVALPYLIYRSYWKSAALVILFSLIFLFIPAIYFGWDQCIFLIKEWRTSIDPTNEMNIFDVSTNDIHGIASLITILFIPGIDDIHTLHISRHIFELDKGIVKVIIYGSRLILIVGTVYFLRTRPFKKQHESLSQIWELGYILLITPLVFPQQRLYAFYFLFPAMTYLVYCFIVIRKKNQENKIFLNVLLCLFTAGVIVFNLELILGNFREYYWHFKTVTYSVLVLIIIYSLLTPKVLRLKSKIILK